MHKSLEPFGRHRRLPKSWRRAKSALRRYPPHVQSVLVQHWKSTDVAGDPHRFLTIVHHFETMLASRKPVG